MKRKHASSGFWYVTHYGERFRKVMQHDRDLRDILEEFSGAPVGRSWVPPQYEIVGKGPWPDWMAYYVPLLSERAVLCLRELIAPHCEILPWIKEPGHTYSLINTITQVPAANWSCRKSSRYGDVYAAADVISLHDIDVPDLFRLEGYDGKLFVSDAVASTSVEQQLKGALFVDPSIPEMHLSFIPVKFGKRGTGFVRREDSLDADPRPALH